MCWIINLCIFFLKINYRQFKVLLKNKKKTRRRKNSTDIISILFCFVNLLTQRVLIHLLKKNTIQKNYKLVARLNLYICNRGEEWLIEGWTINPKLLPVTSWQSLTIDCTIRNDPDPSIHRLILKTIFQSSIRYGILSKIAIFKEVHSPDILEFVKEQET